MPKTYYYLESDGQVFLLKKGRLWQFPSKKSEIPCRYKVIAKMPLAAGAVYFCKPQLSRHPFHWFHKDEVVGRVDVAEVVHQAINRSLPRAAAKVAIIEKGRVLMVKAARGITEGYWNLPGGFVGYGEHPAESVQREALEELGIRITLKRLLGSFTQVFPRTGGYMISFVYEGKRLPGPIKPHPEEIAAYDWFPVKQAMRSTKNPFAKAGLKAYLKTGVRHHNSQ